MIPKPGLLSELAEGQNRDLHRLQESSVGQNANSLISDVSGIFSELQGARKSFVPEERKNTERPATHTCGSPQDHSGETVYHSLVNSIITSSWTLNIAGSPYFQ